MTQSLTARAAHRLGTLRRTLMLIWTIARVWTIAWGILLILQGIIPVLIVALTRDAVNAIVGLVQNGWTESTLIPALLPVIGLAALQILNTTLGGLLSWVREGQNAIITDTISEQVNTQAARLDIGYFEQQDFYDKLHRVRFEARERPIVLLESLGMLFRSGLSLIGMIGLLAAYNIWLPVLLVGSAIPAALIILRFTHSYDQWRHKTTLKERRAVYYEYLLTERNGAGELRLFDLGTHYRDRFSAIRAEIRAEKLQLQRRRLIFQLLATLFAALVGGAAIAWMGWRALAGIVTLGDLTAFYQIFVQLQLLLESITGRFGDIYQSILFIDDLFAFLDLQPRITEAPAGSPSAPALTKTITFENLSFRYGDSERDVLHDFSLTIPAGKIIAIVGENGGGKTSLMKLLCRFYDPQGGRILWDGVDIRDYPVTSLHQQITMLFQIPQQYQETAAENIDVSARTRTLSPTREQIISAAQAAAAHEPISRLPKSYDSMLGRWFGGEELSVGQWQRVALARAFVRDASLIILDEPTSAMDAWAEMDWLNRLRALASGKTLIMITHRFTTAMQADQIFVLHEGHIVEQGTHDKLLTLNGRYAQSWQEQMRT